MADYHRPDQQTLHALKSLGNKIRIHSVETTGAAGSGHPTSCASIADIMAVLFGHVMKYTLEEPRHPSSDRFILSKGHAAPALYAAWAEMGLFPTSELKNLRKLTSDLEGHPTPRLSFVDVATGSLGQGLSVGAGMAYTGKYLERASYRVYCLIGDGESAEGSIWEAMAFASYYKLDNLVAILDVNRLGQSQGTPLEHDLDTYKRRCEAFGFHSYVVDGHDVDALCKAFHDASTIKDKPSAIIAKTFKGHGFPSEIADKENWHGKPLGAKAEETLKTLYSEVANGTISLQPRAMSDDCPPIPKGEKIEFNTPLTYELGQKIAPRMAYGDALVRLGKSCSRVIALDGDTKNSTFSLKFRDAFPDRFIECFIAEQNLVGVGMGCATRNRAIPFVSTFGAFFTRAFDQIRMGAVSQTNCNFVGSHVGVSIGEDGPSQMALEDIAMFRSTATSTVFYPSDAVSCERAVELAANTPGICYIRTSRPALPVIYSNDQKFGVGKGMLVRSSNSDQVTVVGAGITLTHAMMAHERLASEGINIRVIDVFSIKPIDAALLKESAKHTKGKVITVEDHYPEGGIGEAVASALSGELNVQVHIMAVNDVPRSGKSDELLQKYGIDSQAIYDKVKSVI